MEGAEANGKANAFAKALKLLNKAGELGDVHYVQRALRLFSAIRKQDLGSIIAEIEKCECGEAVKEEWSEAVAAGRALLFGGESSAVEKEKRTIGAESALFIGLVILVRLVDTQRAAEGQQYAAMLASGQKGHTQRTVDAILAKVYFYMSRAYEQTEDYGAIRKTLHEALQTAILKRHHECQAVLQNVLLQNYIHHRLYDQAEKLASRLRLPADANPAQVARYLYYTARIEAVQLEYTAAHQHVQDATRKATMSRATAGFQQAAHKLFLLVALLMGEIPERAIFHQPLIRRPLQPYMELVQAVRRGALAHYQQVVGQHRALFETDGVLVLVLRLRHNVIKAGIRAINRAYSRISLRDVCLKLHLDSEEDAEYIVAKAIRDGVCDATIDHAAGCLRSKPSANAYCSDEPQELFGERIRFCLALHNDSVRAMRYPENEHRKELESAAEARERERELAAELAEDEFDDDGSMDPF